MSFHAAQNGSEQRLHTSAICLRFCNSYSGMRVHTFVGLYKVYKLAHTGLTIAIAHAPS